ncbi:MAG: xanthine dehydrogenase family protein subunit M [Chloroflexi bacterium]|nr:xanthine dehydrogenase family protein subunit M [Chloroflexota bacterium]MCI0783000.1 xanthine dehydrogenase family protein subunit M [Chloroflexota bacterium]MCI0814632.1 xanthine dehydrogenase family protein subunit M [Chloroflexota bacterium]MCI0817469.1 xanthine dehydrogenase family protein subunit M [Chloroflexota bacterium]MCI0819170.1 xanthine dehydrogenase family protein subunit M [Chloroflexota bacterium]
MRTFEYKAPETIDEAVSLLKEAGGSARPLAGGTDLVVQLKERATRFPYPATIVSLDRVSELRGIDFSETDGLRLGAGATMTDVAGHPAVRERYAALAQGAGVVGSLQTMNMATIGGNVCNAAPSADTAPPLLVYEAEAVIVGPNGRRTLPIAEFFRGPGETALASDELLAELRLPLPPSGTGAAFQRNTPRKQMDIAVVGVAVALTLSGDTIERARVALGAVAPTPLRATAAEAALQGQTANEETFAKAAAAAVQDSSPISDLRASAEFRRHLVKVMTARLLAEAANRAKGSS